MPTIAAGQTLTTTLVAGTRFGMGRGNGTYRVGPLGTSAAPTIEELIDPEGTWIGPFGADCALTVRATTAVTYNIATPFDPLTMSDVAGLNSLVSGAGNGNAYGYPLSLLDTSNISLWNDLNGAGVTATVDTAVLFNGQPTIRLDIPALFSGNCRIGTSGATVRFPYAYDKKNFAFAIMSSNLTAIDGCQPFVGDAAYANFWSVNNQSASNQPQMQFAANQWMVFKPADTDWVVNTGTPAAAQNMRLRMNFNITSQPSPTKVWLGGVFVMTKRAKPTIIPIFDDGFVRHYDVIAPLFRRYRIPCSFAVCSGLLGQANYMTAAQATALHNDPSKLFELINHNYLHKNVNQFATAADYVADVERCRSDLQGLGVGQQAYMHAYPNSIWRDDVSDLLASKGYLVGRASSNSVYGEMTEQMIRAGDKLRWKLNIIANLQTGTTPANVQAAIDAIKANGGFGTINAHDFQAADGAFIYSYDNAYQVASILAAERDAGNIELMNLSTWYQTYVK